MRVLVVILALAALAAVAFYAVQKLPANIEADLKRRATEALTEAKLPFANVSVKGRVVTLSGEAPGATAKAQAVKIASEVWGVASVQDEIAVNTAAADQPQGVIGMAASEDTQAPATSPPTQDKPPSPQPNSPPPDSPLPNVAGLVDPALAPPAEPKVPPTEPKASTTEPAPDGPAAPPEQPASPSPAAETPSPPAETPPPSAEKASAPAAQTRTALADQPEVPPQAPPAAAETPAAPAAPAPAPPVPPAPAPPPAAIAEGASAGLTTSVQVAATPATPSYSLEAQIEGRRVQLQGLVSTPSAERALVAHVRRHIRRAQIADAVKVAHSKPDADWLGVARTGLAQLARLDTGSLHLDGRSVSLSGRPKKDRDRDSILAAMNTLPAGFTSSLLLERTAELPPAPQTAAPPPPPAAPPAVITDAPKQSEPAPRPAHVAPRQHAPRYRTARYHAPVIHTSLSSECRSRFGDVLPRVAVEFESGSSRVRASAVAGLDELARIALTCPRARIRLTGHSDTHEAPAYSQGLARERALAVREALEDRGVASSSISIASRGGTRPAFSNATSDGRENNRRVEFAVW